MVILMLSSYNLAVVLGSKVRSNRAREKFVLKHSDRRSETNELNASLLTHICTITYTYMVVKTYIDRHKHGHTNTFFPMHGPLRRSRPLPPHCLQCSRGAKHPQVPVQKVCTLADVLEL